MMGAPHRECTPWSLYCLVESQVQDLRQRPQLCSSGMQTYTPQFDLLLLGWILIYVSSSKWRLFWQSFIGRSGLSLTWPLWVCASILLITGTGLLLLLLLPCGSCSQGCGSSLICFAEMNERDCVWKSSWLINTEGGGHWDQHPRGHV